MLAASSAAVSFCSAYWTSAIPMKNLCALATPAQNSASPVIGGAGWFTMCRRIALEQTRVAISIARSRSADAVDWWPRHGRRVPGPVFEVQHAASVRAHRTVPARPGGDDRGRVALSILRRADPDRKSVV